jgi:2Fe-2S ferredoxin
VKIVATDRNGVSREIEGNEGWTVMEALRDAGLPIVAECGGACSCATCHVYVEEGWFEKLPAQRAEEIDMLDMALEVRANSRLSCQIVCSADTDGIKVTLAPE